MERWVYGSGCPAIRAAFSLRRGNDNIIEVALQQRGSTAARTAARRALTQDKNNAAGVIRVLVRELEATTEHAVFLGSEVRKRYFATLACTSALNVYSLLLTPLQPSKQVSCHLFTVAQDITLHALKLAMKVNQRRNKRRAADAIDDTSLRGSNVMYGLVDPHAEWLARPVVLQSEAMLEMQVEHSKDVLAQVGSSSESCPASAQCGSCQVWRADATQSTCQACTVYSKAALMTEIALVNNYNHVAGHGRASFVRQHRAGSRGRCARFECHRAARAGGAGEPARRVRGAAKDSSKPYRLLPVC